ncbi:uncharacterized protein VTP21DRAFT_5592 [Calcarisporiella thermophila]|uniref:uncharacterized protein n=1 Tax=Calcarisporiella thermophila TaxID=911321 RepID=UPI0037435055
MSSNNNNDNTKDREKSEPKSDAKRVVPWRTPSRTPGRTPRVGGSAVQPHRPGHRSTPYTTPKQINAAQRQQSGGDRSKLFIPNLHDDMSASDLKSLSHPTSKSHQKDLYATRSSAHRKSSTRSKGKSRANINLHAETPMNILRFLSRLPGFKSSTPLATPAHALATSTPIQQQTLLRMKGFSATPFTPIVPPSSSTSNSSSTSIYKPDTTGILASIEHSPTLNLDSETIRDLEEAGSLLADLEQTPSADKLRQLSSIIQKGRLGRAFPELNFDTSFLSSLDLGDSIDIESLIREREAAMEDESLLLEKDSLQEVREKEPFEESAKSDISIDFGKDVSLRDLGYEKSDELEEEEEEKIEEMEREKTAVEEQQTHELQDEELNELMQDQAIEGDAFMEDMDDLSVATQKRPSFRFDEEVSFDGRHDEREEILKQKRMPIEPLSILQRTKLLETAARPTPHTTAMLPPPAPTAVPGKKPRKPRAKKQKRFSAAGYEVPNLPNNLIKQILSTFARGKISKDALDAVIEGSHLYFEQLSEDLSVYSQHAGRKTIEDDDVLMLMRRQRVLSSKATLESLAHKFLPRELSEEVCVAATAENVEHS